MGQFPQILRSHSDFKNDINPPVQVPSTEPRFRLVQSVTKRTVLVLDVSGSMGTDRALIQNQVLHKIDFNLFYNSP